MIQHSDRTPGVCVMPAPGVAAPRAVLDVVEAGSATDEWRLVAAADAVLVIRVLSTDRVCLESSPAGAAGGPRLEVPASSCTVDLLRCWLAAAAQQRALGAELADERARVDFLHEAAELGFWDMDVAANRTRRNARHDQLFGYDQMLPSWGYDDFLAHIHPDDRARVHEAYQAALGGNGIYNVEFRTTWADGTEHWLWSRGRFILDDEGKPLRAAGVMSFITARKHAEEQLRRLDREDLVGRFAAGVAHDFNNLLSVILGGVEFLLERTSLDVEARNELEQVGSATKRSAALVRELLTLSRQDMVRLQPLDLSLLLGDLEAPLRHLVGPTVTVRVVRPAESLIVRGDTRQLEQVLLNLAANARDAMPAGGTLDVVLELATGGDVRLSMTDSGVGMNEQTLAHCLEPFFTTKPRGRGTGLGLASVHGVVMQMGGTLAVRSQLGAGTTMEILVPRSALVAIATSVDAGDSAIRGDGRRVLLVDDDDGVRHVARRALTSAGYDVIDAASGEDAVRAAIDLASVDVLVTDLVMPTMNGRAVAEAVQTRHPGVRVLLISGYSDDEIARLGVESGKYELLGKPFSPSELVRRVGQLLGDARAA